MRNHLLPAVGLVVILLLAGCGGAGKDAPAEAQTAPSPGAVRPAGRSASATQAANPERAPGETAPETPPGGEVPAEASAAVTADVPGQAVETAAAPTIEEQVRAEPAPKPRASVAGRAFTATTGMRFRSFDVRGARAGFWLGVYEVTQEQYESVMGTNPSRYVGERRPVEYVSWLDAVRFANAMSEREGLEPCYDDDGDALSANVTSCDGYRLPTNAEWEQAARGIVSEATDRTTLQSVAWVETNALGKHHEIGTKGGSEEGMFDLIGNVSEWVHEGQYRGGSWKTPVDVALGPENVRADRSRKDPGVGMRLARSLF